METHKRACGVVAAPKGYRPPTGGSMGVYRGTRMLLLGPTSQFFRFAAPARRRHWEGVIRESPRGAFIQLTLSKYLCFAGHAPMAPNKALGPGRLDDVFIEPNS